MPKVPKLKTYTTKDTKKIKNYYDFHHSNTPSLQYSNKLNGPCRTNKSILQERPLGIIFFLKVGNGYFR